MGMITDYKGTELVRYQANDQKGFQEYKDGIKLIPGYFIECNDGFTYLVFAPDIVSMVGMKCYLRVLADMKDNARKSIQLACVNGELLYAPASYMGKVFVVDVEKSTGIDPEDFIEEVSLPIQIDGEL